VAYAEAAIPVFLLIDRDSCEVTVFSEPADGRYGSRVTVAFGDEVTLPGLGIVLDTEALQAYVR
jgi:hypothetical protein